MARIRTIKPQFWQSEDMSSISEPACLLAIALLNYADDYGYFSANLKLINAACFPLREPSVSTPVLLIELCGIDYIQMGKCPNGKEYGRIKKFNEHQKINRPTDSKLVDLQIVWNGLEKPSLPIRGNSLITHGALMDNSVNPHGALTVGKEGNKEEERKGEEGKGDAQNSFQSPPNLPKQEQQKNPMQFEMIAQQLMMHVTGLHQIQAVEEAKKMLGKANNPNASYISTWAKNLVPKKYIPYYESPFDKKPSRWVEAGNEDW
jgi:hypothetical protein